VAALLDEVGIGAERRLQLRKFSKGMLQRVGIAQALLNDPEVVFFDEPMSGLDPLGRREIRALILRLRDRGCTVFFSSHVLSDAEALCSRVAVLAGGRLVAVDSLAEVQAFEVRGWELVVNGLDPAVIGRLQAAGRIRSATTLGLRRHTLALDPEVRPEPLVAELAALGGQVVSVQPVRDTLEDRFVRQVGGAAGRAAVEMKR
jgi:ABC-2 type transport system ATP-binding protein